MTNWHALQACFLFCSFHMASRLFIRNAPVRPSWPFPFFPNVQRSSGPWPARYLAYCRAPHDPWHSRRVQELSQLQSRLPSSQRQPKMGMPLDQRIWDALGVALSRYIVLRDGRASTTTHNFLVTSGYPFSFIPVAVGFFSRNFFLSSIESC
ncbi:hypothetical protein B0T11DRAFT_74774 [Plectosphaerella cucumerina]|uniref:Secreted protein n=1 Tax=Plectosphaerella cucumerina TaxID=40658 RepID=A0A8K0TFD5_9PEZI|nr:hypothetical protein B0T11DRAFT_74774 [Plectosphaerella cucumerina]